MFQLSLLLATAALSGTLMPADTLEQARVVADKLFTASSRDTVSLGCALSGAEAMLSVPGIQLSDMGGEAGLKTVSFRGLGSAHTLVCIDGIRAVNVQSGQNDLGMYCIEDFDEAVVDYSVNRVSFNTRMPEKSGGRVSLSGGMFNTYRARGEYAQRFNGGHALKAGIGGLYSKGDFPYGEGQRRKGNDMRKIQGGLDYFAPGTHVKAYVNASDRGTPGSVSWPSEDRQKDINALVQGSWSSRWDSFYSLGIDAKVSHDRLSYSTSFGNSLYAQTSALATVRNGFRIRGWLSALADIDLEADHLGGDYGATRVTFRPEAALCADLRRFKASLGAEFVLAADAGHKTRHALSPSLQLKYLPAEGLALTAFTRRAYRIPTFNELYYTGFGNPELKNEDAWLTDAGASYSHAFGPVTLKASADFFYSHLTDKITSAPTPEDPNIWMPLNIGTVGITGTDVMAGASWKGTRAGASLSARYTFTSAVDRTADSYSYGQQIAYVPKHSASVVADLSFRQTFARLSWNLRDGRRDSYTDMPSWNTLDLTMTQGIGKHVKLSLHGRNLTNRRYEISSGYPMPGISVIGGVEVMF